MQRNSTRFMLLVGLLVSTAVPVAAEDKPRPARFLDLDGQAHRQVVVDREAGQYLGHPTTVLLEDNRTMLCVYPKGHGRGAIVYKRSNDAGLTWSKRLPTPASWATSKEVPTLHRVIDPGARSESSCSQACIRVVWRSPKMTGEHGRS